MKTKPLAAESLNGTDLETHDKGSRFLLLLIPISGAIFIFVITAYVANFATGISPEQEIWGQFGDYVGGVLNPIFGFLSLIALLFTLRLQARELRISTQELRNSAVALEEQCAAMTHQNFETTFFQLLRLHNDIVQSIDLRSGGSKTLKGRDCFARFSSVLLEKLRAHNVFEDPSKLDIAYDDVYKKYKNDLGHYFRLLYNLVKFIHNSEALDKKFYSNLVRAQLSSEELNLLFVNCLSDKGREKFKPLVEEYALLKTMENDSPLTPPTLKSLYSSSAFGA
jgi:uncharacterized membrane protein